MSTIGELEIVLGSLIQRLATAGFAPSPTTERSLAPGLSLALPSELSVEVDNLVATCNRPRVAEALQAEYYSAIDALRRATRASFASILDHWAGSCGDIELMMVSKCMRERFEQECTKCTAGFKGVLASLRSAQPTQPSESTHYEQVDGTKEFFTPLLNIVFRSSPGPACFSKVPSNKNPPSLLQKNVS